MSFLRKPQSLWWRKLIFQIHLWLGIGTSLYIVLIGVTGSALVFHDELDRAAHSSLIRVPDSQGPRADLETVAANIRTAFPGAQITALYVPTPKVQTFQSYIQRGENYSAVFAHPVTGKVVGTVQDTKSFLRWLQLLHFNLLAGRTGRVVNAIGGIFLTLMTLTGLVIWWPGIARWRRALTVDFTRKWKRINWDLHSALGFWTLAIVFMWGVTGAYFGFPMQFRAVINRFSPTFQFNAKSDVRAKGKAAPVSLSTLRQRAEEAAPEAKFAGIFFPAPKAPTATYLVYMARKELGDFNNYNFLYFDQYTGKLISIWRRGVNDTVGDKILYWFGALHFGDFGGSWIKAIWVLLGLAPPVLTVTGLLMYWNRALSKTWRRLKASNTAPAAARIKANEKAGRTSLVTR